MSFTEIAKQILHDAEQLDAYIAENHLPPPSFDVNGPPMTMCKTKETLHAHADILASAHKLTHLAQGPAASWLGTMNGGAGDVVTGAAIYKFNIAEHVPLDKAVSFEEVAEKCGLDLRDFKMIVRYAMTNFIFRESKPGYIAQTASSKVLKEKKLIRSLMGMGGDEILPAMMTELDVMGKYPGSQEPSESAWSIANNTTLPMFAALQQHHPHRAATMAFAMEALAGMFADSLQLSCYDRASLGKATIVDIGGGKGFAGRVLSYHFPELRFIVQDLEDTVKAGQAQLPAELKDKISFQVHDFFTSQTEVAECYYFRAIMHDWSDKYCIEILRALIPALRKGSRVVVHDPHTKDVGTMNGLWQDRLQRASNLRVKTFFNAHNRETSEWEDLFARADRRFRIKSIKVHDRVPNNDIGETMAVVEAVWEG